MIIVKTKTNTLSPLNQNILWAFNSDSVNVMRKLRRLLLNGRTVDVASGCVPHCLNNFSQDIIELRGLKGATTGNVRDTKNKGDTTDFKNI